MFFPLLFFLSFFRIGESGEKRSGSEIACVIKELMVIANLELLLLSDDMLA